MWYQGMAEGLARVINLGKLSSAFCTKGLSLCITMEDKFRVFFFVATHCQLY